MPELPLRINNIGRPESHSEIGSILNQAPIAPRNALINVTEHGEVHLTQATLLPRLLRPLHMREHRVDRAAEQVRPVIQELLSLVAEGDDFGGAHECEVEGPEEQDDPLSSVVLEGDLFEAAFVEGVGFEGGRGLADLGDAALVVVVFVGHLVVSKNI